MSKADAQRQAALTGGPQATIDRLLKQRRQLRDALMGVISLLPAPHRCQCSRCCGAINAANDALAEIGLDFPMEL